MTTTTPIYTTGNLSSAYQLNWGLTIFWRQQPVPETEWLTLLQSTTEPDGGRVLKHPMADPRVQALLLQYQATYAGIDLSQPVRSAHGEYWYNLHLVLVNDHRWTEIRPSVLDKLNHVIEPVAAKHGHRLSRIGLLADHIHMTLGCVIDQSPDASALCPQPMVEDDTQEHLRRENEQQKD